jgi:hypothetical protein
MMNKLALIFLLTVTLSTAASALDYKKEGAICDSKSGYCVDFMGVSVALTRLYLGERAEKKLMAEINKVGLADFDATTFTLSGGLTCETLKKMCWTSRSREKLHKKATQTLFGKQ